ncbi:MAG: DUF1343 domain-containing protein [Calditrichaeota bacterium]|nr:MAG: DUF1343 domain-containing protein [Calditrichota bacterium]
MKKVLTLVSIIILCVNYGFAGQAKTGLDVLKANEFKSLHGLRIGVITNQTAVDFHGTHIIELFKANENVQLTAIFGPEHGVFGKAEAGKKIASTTDSTKIPVYSLYGITRSPTADMFKNIDALVFDIQDVGTRFYTYISTMCKTMEAAAEFGVKYIVLDRPNPIGGLIVEGPVLDPELKSFVGIQPIALRHAMTVGELATMFNEEGWLQAGKKVDLTIIKMQDWQRHMHFEDTGLSWIPPSPNMPTTQTALLYCGMGLIEGTNFSEGRGTRAPFQKVGAPWLDANILIARLKEQNIQGIRLKPVRFTPIDIPGMATNNKYSGEICQGIEVSILDAANFKSVEFGFKLLTSLQELYPQHFELKPRRLNKLSGQNWVANAIKDGRTSEQMIASSQGDLHKFEKIRKKYLLY